jgi:hypothetical protein
MRGALVIALCATGCFSDHGVAIEVAVDDPSVASVKLFIGQKECVQETAPGGVRCDAGIAPINEPTLLPGKIFFRDAPAGDKALADENALVDGSRTVTFRLKADASMSLPIVIVVGFDQAMQPIAAATLQPLEVPANSARIVKTTLVRAGSQPGEDRVRVWPTPTSSCVAVKNGLSTMWNFVVPADDVDCDGLPNPSNTECNANAYLGSTASGQAPTPDCFGKDPSGSCMLGSLACVDGRGTTPNTCAAQSPQHDTEQVCVPPQFCNTLCTGLECPPDSVDLMTSPIPRVECHVATTFGGDLCPGSGPASIDLDMFYPGNEQCDQQPLLGAFQFASLPTSSTHTFGGGALMGLENLKSPCNFTITWKSGTRSPPDGGIDNGVIRLQTGNRITLLPIVFRFIPGCAVTEQFACSPAGDPLALDSLWTCAHAP